MIERISSLEAWIDLLGLVDELLIMVITIVNAVVVMLFASKPISDFADHTPKLKNPALSLLILMGMTPIEDKQ